MPNLLFHERSDAGYRDKPAERNFEALVARRPD
jgi:hypothetical protein